DGKILGLRNDSVLLLTDQGGSFFYTGGWRINNLSVAEDKLLVCEQLASDSGRVTVVTSLGQVERILQATGALRSPRQALLVQGEAWVADSLTGLSAWGASGDQARGYIPNSPFGLTMGPMVIHQDPTAGPGGAGVLWVASGGVDTNWTALRNYDGLYRRDGNGWT